MIDQLPQYRAHLSRHGHNLSHKFDFTSSTGHLLTLFSQIMNPKETISGKIEMFSRTQPLNTPSHVDIDTFIDYFFVPLDMLYSGFGDSLYQVNEPYSTVVYPTEGNNLPVYEFSNLYNSDLGFMGSMPETGDDYIDFNNLDYYMLDSSFMSFYRNFFHNYLNPNFFFRDYNDLYGVPYDSFQPNILPLTLMSYNCVYENFYRFDEREKFDNTIYNIDNDVLSHDSAFRSLNPIKLFCIKYRPLSFDYFTSSKVSPIINGQNMVGNPALSNNLVKVNNYLSSIGVNGVGEDGRSVPYISNIMGAGLASATSGGTNLNTNALRSMFAVEKILSITGRAKKTYDAQVLAHLGVEVPRDIKHEITFIGSQKGSIKIGEIIATAGTSDTPLGDMAGKGYGAMNNKSIKFTAPCHGVFIAIYSAVPKLSYYAPLEKHEMITSRLDFWHPEFEKLGMQPIFGYEAVAVSTNSSITLGWQMRYEQYKTRFDKVSPAFIDTIVHTSGTGSSPIAYESSTFNTWQNWVLSTRPLRLNERADGTTYTSLSRFLSHPTDLNNIMSLRYGWWNDSVTSDSVPDFWKLQPLSTELSDRTSFGWNVASLFYRDPLLHFANIDFKLVSSMGENTLPDLNF